MYSSFTAARSAVPFDSQGRLPAAVEDADGVPRRAQRRLCPASALLRNARRRTDNRGRRTERSVKREPNAKSADADRKLASKGSARATRGRGGVWAANGTGAFDSLNN